MKYKVVVIGAGNIARTVHLPGFGASPLCGVAAVCDVNRAAAAATAQQFGVPNVYTDYTEMLAVEKPDITCVCTPNSSHHPIVMAALAAGSHVLCEKPPACTYAQALEMHEAAVKAERTLGYNFCYRFSGEAEALRAALADGQLGTVYAGRVTALRRRAVPGWGVFTNKEVQGGGPLIDIGVHMLDLALWLLNSPTPSYAAAGSHDLIGKAGGEGLFGSWEGESYTVEDSLFGLIRFQNGITLNLETAFALHLDQRATTNMNVALYGNKAGAAFNPSMLYTNEGACLVDKNLPVKPVDFRLACAADFVAALEEGRAPRGDSASALCTQQVIEMLYQSAETNLPVILQP